MNLQQRIQHAVLTAPPLPPAGLKALSLLSDPEADMGQIADAVRLDPGLTANILRLANSPLLRGLTEISTLKEALIRLGPGRVARMAAGLSLAPLAKKALRGYDVGPGGLMTQSAVAGLLAEQIVRADGPALSGPAFTASLLAGVGKVVLGTFLGVDVAPILQLSLTQNITFDAAERAIIGLDHAAVGAMLLDHWHLPESIVAAVRWHLHPEQAPVPSRLIDVTHVARLAAAQTGLGTGLEGLRFSLSSETVARLGLHPEELERLLSQIMEEGLALGELFCQAA